MCGYRQNRVRTPKRDGHIVIVVVVVVVAIVVVVVVVVAAAVIIAARCVYIVEFASIPLCIQSHRAIIVIVVGVVRMMPIPMPMPMPLHRSCSPLSHESVLFILLLLVVVAVVSVVRFVFLSSISLCRKNFFFFSPLAFVRYIGI